MAEILTPDICVIGAGSGGLTVAGTAARFGVPVVLVEKGLMGGDCLNFGCVPSKALIAAAKAAHRQRNASGFGMADVVPEIDFARVHRHIREVIGAIAPNDSAERFTALGVRVVAGEARFRDAGTVVVPSEEGDCEIRARRFVVATGSSPSIPEIPGLDKAGYLTNETIFDLTERPGHLVVIGGGPLGMELAGAYRRLGSDVTVLEAGRVLAREDPELATVVRDALRREGVVIHERARAVDVERKADGSVRVTVKTETGVLAVEGTHILAAAGRTANVEGLDLAKAGIAFDRSGIKVDRRLRSTNRHVYAIGDVAGGPQFTHVANYHAGLVLRALLFRLPAAENLLVVPRVTYTDPELAHVGLTEEEARKAHGAVRVMKSPYAENDRAWTERQTEGFIKLVVGRRGRVLGVSIVGAGAGEMAGFWALALSKKMSVRDIAGHVAPYPTLEEIGKRAALAYFSDATRSGWVRWLVGFLRRFG
ncbi:MAG: FAD-dependent oxidoreductase [Hyphomicrobiales bacterium]|nr:FAD-dependent oxidoreductase [Hyphomicrobiales bacterium]